MNKYFIFLFLAFTSTSTIASQFTDSTSKTYLSFKHQQKSKTAKINVINKVIVKTDSLKYKGILLSVKEESLTLLVAERGQIPLEVEIPFENIMVITEVRKGPGLEALSGLMMISGVPVVGMGISFLEGALRHNNLPDVLTAAVMTSGGILLFYGGLLIRRKRYNIENKWAIST